MPEIDPDLSGTLHDLLSSVVPYPVFRVLAGFSNLIYTLLGSSNDPTSWTSTLLPPLITFLLAYTALVIAYRTVRNMISLVWWGVKWGAILGAALAIWAWWTDNTDAISSVGQPPASGMWDQMGRLNTFMSIPAVSAIYSQLSGGASGSQARRSTPYSSFRDREPSRRSRRGGRPSSTTTGDDIDDFLPGNFGATGSDAFGDLFRNVRGNNDGQAGNDAAAGGIDFGNLLNMIITEGQRQGIDAASALRAAGRVQDEVKRFQENPTAWFQAVGSKFRMTGSNQDGGIPAQGAAQQEDDGIGSRTRARRARDAARQDASAAGSSWMGSILKGLGSMMQDSGNVGSTAGSRRSTGSSSDSRRRRSGNSRARDSSYVYEDL